jgi:hypothetical protein
LTSGASSSFKLAGENKYLQYTGYGIGSTATTNVIQSGGSGTNYYYVKLSNNNSKWWYATTSGATSSLSKQTNTYYHWLFIPEADYNNLIAVTSCKGNETISIDTPTGSKTVNVTFNVAEAGPVSAFDIVMT